MPTHSGVIFQNISFRLRFALTILFTIFWSQNSPAEFDLECYIKGDCRHSVGGGSSANPSAGNEIRLNPAAVPTEKGLGIEAINYSTTEWSVVQGLGWAGAAISPANSEETFFGPPAIEYSTDYLNRYIAARKYESQKYTLASAFKLIDKSGSGLSRFNLNLGAMIKYNKYTARITPGGGLTGSMGPFLFGYSYYLDETQLDPQLNSSLRPPASRYSVQTFNVGLYLTSMVLNYSNLQMTPENSSTPPSTVTVIMASLLTQRFIFNLAARTEDSSRPWYNPETSTLVLKQIKKEYFGGIQYRFTKNLMAGTFYNYYLFQELSLTATLFF